ncbi:MAG TPA: cytochrome c oxidase subunit II [Candidatus Thiothrix moscowensis]|uniref:cytochrome c oxidase subunit II n=1 Tax=unclassified Thiothrix TaxID=2636184 RepID=UPI0025E42CAE|nr:MULTISPECIES: cytochrome c oxidase subunit II [unclassified Thiothrix]HRJ51386.1 cytochrome c oxidase subunit II [Candidatus Thiothrix moscowensis]HRJ91559.1 cytochrome c oxidase subunit II [Candidatus Thiothrix moscowensis]
MVSKNKTGLPAALLLLPLGLLTSIARADYGYNLPEPAATLTQEIFDLHMLTTVVGTVIMVIVTAMIVYALYAYRHDKGAVPDQNFHTSWFGRWAWVLVPVIVLGIDLSIASSASSTLSSVEDRSKADVTVKVIGSQWKWTYEYMDDDIKVVSNLKKLEPTDPLYLRDVDDPLVLPTGQRVRFLLTSTDVLHNWGVAEIVPKKINIPGYINETWAHITKEGTYRGQCYENCGAGHAFMPAVVRAVSPAEYQQWKTERKAQQAQAAAEASSDKAWAKEELMAKGQEIYTKNCMACHQAQGQGIPGVFPALAGSKIANGAAADHINIVVKGKTGTAMAAWGPQLNDLDIAAVVTFERNSWGNTAGDVVQPKDIKAAR